MWLYHLHTFTTYNTVTKNTIACTSYITVTNYINNTLKLQYDCDFSESKYLNYLHYY